MSSIDFPMVCDYREFFFAKHVFKNKKKNTIFF